MTVNYNFKMKPFAHQVTALEKGWDRTEFGLFMEMGTGKSKVLLDNMGMLFRAAEINFALVIAPKGVYRNWVAKEIPEHMSDDIPHRVIRWVSSANKKQKKEMRSVQDPFSGLTIFVMNVEAFSTAKGKQAGEWMARAFGQNGLIAIDESTKIKNHKAKRTKNLCDIASKFKYRRILTGSPITKSPLDIYSQCDFLRQGILGHTSYYGFQNTFAVLRQQRAGGGRTFQQVVGYKNLETLGQQIDKCSYRVLKKDCLDLPEKIYTARYVSLTPEQLDMYVTLQKEALLLLDNGDMVSAPAVITQMLRVQQVLSGHLKTDDGEMIYFPSKRMEALQDILAEHQGKAMIWSRFRHDIVEITKMLNKTFGSGSAASYYGDTSDDERQRIVDQFQEPNSNLMFFVGNPATAGYGLTLTEANLVVYYANDFNLETRLQSEDRAHRIGQKNNVTYVDLISEDTIDEKIVQSLRDKIDIGAKVLREEAREWLKITPTTN
jgi:SNF2 family DNA or RNA helicase